MPIGLAVFDVRQSVPVRRAVGRVVVLVGRLQPMTMVTRVPGGLGGRRHDDVGMSMALGAVCAMHVLDHLEQPVLVGFRIVLMAVLVLVIVPMRHGSMLGQRRPMGAGL